MTAHQNLAIWEMLRQGLHPLALLAEQRWTRSERVEWDDLRYAPNLIRTLVEQGNRQLQQGAA
jgi:hypothetical protein